MSNPCDLVMYLAILSPKCWGGPAEALGLPFVLTSASDPSRVCRKFVSENYGARFPTDWFQSMVDQTSKAACAVHPYASSGCSAAGTNPGGRVLILININHTFFIDIDLVVFY